MAPQTWYPGYTPPIETPTAQPDYPGYVAPLEDPLLTSDVRNKWLGQYPGLTDEQIKLLEGGTDIFAPAKGGGGVFGGGALPLPTGPSSPFAPIVDPITGGGGVPGQPGLPNPVDLLPGNPVDLLPGNPLAPITGGGTTGGGTFQVPGGESETSPYMQDFLQALGRYNPQFFNAPWGMGGAEGTIAAEFRDIGRGTADPRFQAYETAQLNQLENQKQRALGDFDEVMRRRGVGGTAAALQKRADLAQQYDRRASEVTGALGLQQLGRQDQALQTAQQFASQDTAARLGTITAGLENLTTPEALRIAELAARKSGQVSMPESGGIFGDLFGGGLFGKGGLF